MFLITLPAAYGPWMPVLVNLDDVREHLEKPFDRVGPPDVTINVEKLIANLVVAGDRKRQ